MEKLLLDPRFSMRDSAAQISLPSGNPVCSFSIKPARQEVRRLSQIFTPRKRDCNFSVIGYLCNEAPIFYNGGRADKYNCRRDSGRFFRKQALRTKPIVRASVKLFSRRRRKQEAHGIFQRIKETLLPPEIKSRQPRYVWLVTFDFDSAHFANGEITIETRPMKE